MFSVDYSVRASGGPACFCGSHHVRIYQHRTGAFAIACKHCTHLRLIPATDEANVRALQDLVTKLLVDGNT